MLTLLRFYPYRHKKMWNICPKVLSSKWEQHMEGRQKILDHLSYQPFKLYLCNFHYIYSRAICLYIFEIINVSIWLVCSNILPTGFRIKYICKALSKGLLFTLFSSNYWLEDERLYIEQFCKENENKKFPWIKQNVWLSSTQKLFETQFHDGLLCL